MNVNAYILPETKTNEFLEAAYITVNVFNKLTVTMHNRWFRLKNENFFIGIKYCPHKGRCVLELCNGRHNTINAEGLIENISFHIVRCCIETLS